MRLFFKSQSGIPAEPFSCVRDGLTLRGRVFRPAGEKLPAAILCHGFMATQRTVYQYARALAALGYAAFCFDFSGGSVAGSQSDGKTTDMSVLTEVADLEAVLAQVRNLPYVDAENVLLMGCSQGGFVCALTAAKHPELIARLVLFYPALCIPDDARAGKMMFAKFDPQNVPETVRCGPMRLGRRYVTDVLTLDPFAEIQGYDGPVLIVHGTRDAIVAPEYARRAFETYRERPHGKSVRLRLIGGGAHGFSKTHDAAAIDELRRFAAL